MKRRSDTRSLDDKIYKVRLAIPKEISNSKNPENGFVIQESSSTGFTSNDEFTKDDTLTRSDFGFKRNPRFISSCTYNSGTKVITITAEKPHNLATGDLVSIKMLKMVELVEVLLVSLEKDIMESSLLPILLII